MHQHKGSYRRRAANKRRRGGNSEPAAAVATLVPAEPASIGVGAAMLGLVPPDAARPLQDAARDMQQQQQQQQHLGKQVMNNRNN